MDEPVEKYKVFVLLCFVFFSETLTDFNADLYFIDNLMP